MTSTLPAMHALEEEAWKSDYVLSKPSQHQFRCLRDGLQQTLDLHEVEIERAQAALDQLLDQRKSYTLRIARLDSAIAPHKRLPPELFSKIFSDCSPKPLELPSRQFNDDLRLNVLAVCSLWRRIALNTLKLWDNVIVSYPYVQHNQEAAQLQTEGIVAIAGTVLSSGTRCITLRVDHRCQGSMDIHPMRSLIIPFSSQLTHIHLSSPSHLLYQFLQSPPSPFTVLKSLILESEDSLAIYIERDDIQRLTVFGNTPSLDDVRLLYLHLDLLPYLLQDAFDMPWGQLTHIALQRTVIDLTTAHSIVSWCSSAVHFELWITRTSRIQLAPTRSQPIFHPRLQSLKLRSEKSVGALFLQSLVFPSLTAIEFFGKDIAHIIPAFISFSTRSRCLIHKYAAPIATVSTPDLELLLPVLSSVEELLIPKTILTASMLQRISQGLWLPKLECLDCTISSSSETLEHFIGVVQKAGSGNPGPPGLRSATTRYLQRQTIPERSWSDTYARFQKLSEQLRDEGRTLSLEYY
ncbi:hypothetical protein FPV67DRAFT_755530 [Lyophyllum atratum]|nr:hypothetical protein FPV67DRAFT_755530 [Lyophyllum atratum]